MTALANSKYQYVGSVEWSNVAAYPSGTGTNVSAGTLCTNTANSPAVGSERVYVCIIGGTTSGTEPTFTTTKGAITTDNTISWQECTGQPGVNGSTAKSPVWGATLTVILGQIIYDSTSGALQICTVAGTTGSSVPTFSATAGTSTTDNTVTWRSLGAASNFGPWAAPHARTLNADGATWQTVIPAIIFISSTNAETQATALTLQGGQGTASNPNKYLSVNSGSADPTSCTAGASISTTAGAALYVEAYGYWYGVTFSAGSGSTTNIISNGNLAGAVFFDNCTFILNTTSTTASINLGADIYTSFMVTCLNSTFVFGNASQALLAYEGTINIINATIAASGSAPSVLIKALVPGATLLTLRDTDLSNITGTLYSANNQPSDGYILIENCKLASGVAMTTGVIINAATAPFKLHNCDSGSKNYRFYEGSYLGTIQQETTIVDNTNPSSNGNQTISWNIATSANTAFGQPYLAPEIAQWNALTTGSHTATIQINSNVSLNNAQIWMELECLDSSGYPIGSAVSSRVTDALTTPTTYSTSSDSWGGSETYQQYMKVTFSPAMAGYIKVRVYVAIASTTIYVNPLILVV